MARDAKLEAAAINVRIHDEAKRDYVGLLGTIAQLRRGVRVHGMTHIALSHFNADERMGILSQYTEIDVDGPWFNINDFDEASEEERRRIQIPSSLKPNLNRFYFQVDPELHVVVFAKYQQSRSVSAKSVERFFRAAIEWEEVLQEFGRMDVDVIQSYEEVARIIEHPGLRELRLVVRPPNPDDLTEDLAAIIEARLKGQDAEVYEERLKASGGRRLKPDARTRKLAFIAAENGEVHAKGEVDGVATPLTTTEQPQTETATYPSDGSVLDTFKALVERFLGMVRRTREAEAP
jgi:hypothetical protein